mgnify:CR=1 FL=1
MLPILVYDLNTELVFFSWELKSAFKYRYNS